MERIYDWIKNIAFFYILMSAVIHLLPKNSYEKYVRFFCGLLLTVMILTPVVELIYQPEYLLNKIFYESFWQEMNEIQLDVAGMEGIQKQAFQKEYENAIGQDISGMVEEMGMQSIQVDVKLSEEYIVEEINMKIGLGNDSEEIRIEKIMFGDNSSEYPQILELKRKIMEFYQIEENQIRVAVWEG